MCFCCYIPSCCSRNDTLPKNPFQDDPFAQENQAYIGPSAFKNSDCYVGPATNVFSSGLYQTFDLPSKPIKAVLLHPKAEEEAGFPEVPEQFQKEVITNLNWEQANYLALEHPEFALMKLKTLSKENKNSRPEETFFERISSESACKIILKGIQSELEAKENPGEFLRANSSVTRLLSIYFSKNQEAENKDLVIDFVQKIPGRTKDEEEKEMTEERIAKLQRHTERLLEIISQLVASFDITTLNLFVEIKNLIEKRGEINPAYKDTGNLLSFGQFVLRYLNPIVACLELAGIHPDNDPEYAYKHQNAMLLSTILQNLNINPDRNELERKFSGQSVFLIKLISDLQEQFNFIRDSIFKLEVK